MTCQMFTYFLYEITNKRRLEKRSEKENNKNIGLTKCHRKLQICYAKYAVSMGHVLRDFQNRLLP